MKKLNSISVLLAIRHPLSKIRSLAVFFFLLLTVASYAMGNSQNQDNSQNNAAVDQAKKDYTVFLQKLDEMGKQYNQVTGQVKQVVKEEGVPVWDDTEGKFKISHNIDFSGNGNIHETDSQIRVTLEKPGLRKGSIRVTIEDDRVLHLKAFKKSVEAGQSDQVVDEKIQLPAAVSDAHPQAKYEDGILTVTVQKSALLKKTVDVPVQ